MGHAHSMHITYDSEEDGHYINKDDRKEAGMPILRTSTIQVLVAKGETGKANMSLIFLSYNHSNKQPEKTPSSSSQHH